MREAVGDNSEFNWGFQTSYLRLIPYYRDDPWKYILYLRLIPMVLFLLTIFKMEQSTIDDISLLGIRLYVKGDASIGLILTWATIR